MNVKKMMVACVIVLAVFLSDCATAPAGHPNLSAAQQYIQNAIDKLTAAQMANDFDMKGHAAKAKALLEQALGEIKLAAQAADAK